MSRSFVPAGRSRAAAIRAWSSCQPDRSGAAAKPRNATTATAAAAPTLVARATVRHAMLLPARKLHRHGEPLVRSGANGLGDLRDAALEHAARVALRDVGVDEHPLEVREPVVEPHRDEVPRALAFEWPDVMHYTVRRYAYGGVSAGSCPPSALDVAPPDDAPEPRSRRRRSRARSARSRGR